MRMTDAEFEFMMALDSIMTANNIMETAIAITEWSMAVQLRGKGWVKTATNARNAPCVSITYEGRHALDHECDSRSSHSNGSNG